MKKSTTLVSVTILAVFLLLLGIGALFGGSSGGARPAWTPASFYSAVAQTSAATSLYA